MNDRDKPVPSNQALSSNKGFGPGETGDFPGASGLLFEQAMAQTRMAVCLTDPLHEDDPIVFCNEAFERLTGYGRNEIIGRNCRFLQGSETDQDEVGRIREALREEKVAVVELLNYRKDGTKFWNALHLGPIYDEKNKLKYFFGSQWDVSDVHAARAEERHAKAMARGVSHRLKNVFAVIGGIVNITGRSMGAREVSTRINERIQALGRSYEPTLDEAFLGTTDVGQAVRAVLRPYDPEDGRFTFTGGSVRTEPNAISAIGLTLHELATNASKYGALTTDDGHIDVSWRHKRDRFGRGSLLIAWKETCGPPIDSPPSSGGTGFQIANALLSNSRGALDRYWEADGLRAEIHFPLEV
ncbi:PAS domain-containing protein [Erythrobacter litoralis]|uniref:PAS domain-containing protein n=1 Tax=Erythrobacter litoralis TaxID=39960 RepID=UPI0024359D59|nr:PAS domain-containing protein [Erythrobacter litoralis]MDG6080260.1 PAS domain-containing protein [Erythrobacter litoralis]